MLSKENIVGIINKIKEEIACPLYPNEELKNHTTFKVGGPCYALIEPRSYEEVRKVVMILKEKSAPFFIIGNGSNLLVSDRGLDEFIIKIGSNLSEISIDDTRVKVQAGCLLSKASKTAISKSLKGMEFSSGIPGNIGGGIAMNAGAYGGEMKDIVESVKVLDKNSDIIDIKASDMNFRYRGSRVFDENLIVLEATFKLEHGDYEEIYANFQDLDKRRRDKQPLEYPSAGSTFKRPEGHFAGKLIEDAGLKGYRYKNAMVSQKHSGFVITDGQSSCSEILQVIRHVQEVVKDKFLVDLETEVKILGE